MISFRSIFEVMGPGWLTTGDGAKVFYSVGVMLDATVERMRQALVARFPEYTETPDTLAPMGRDRRIIRGRNESDASYAKRLVAWRYPFGHRTRGSAFGLLSQIKAYFLDQTFQATVDRRGNTFAIAPDGTETRTTQSFAGGDDIAVSSWSRFWIKLVGVPGWSHPTWVFEDPELWGGVLEEESEYVLDIAGATYSDIVALRAIAADWKMAGSRAEYLYVSMNPVGTDFEDLTDADVSWHGYAGAAFARAEANVVPVKL